jgi:membrane-bound ClpP family serine protease
MTTNTKLALQNVFGVLLLILSIPMFLEGGVGILGSLFMIIGGLVSIPQTRQLIEKRFNVKFSKSVKIILIIFGWLSIGMFSKPTPQTVTENAANEQKTTTSAATVVSVGDTLEATNVLNTESKNAITSIEENQAYSSGVNTVKGNKKRNSNSSGNGGYIRGPRGGCYYINSKGNKVYVDHSYCN